ncbi:MAG TPA: BglG family transcription antiterminator [Paenibacillus sp.]|uniref:BglG family transcription antiterminator n=1 Tax=Paenibacillus sp. TaxID=58172 RepID=UPI002B75978C|nr:BglG family transcription antiterminator [Paenibacillus sp.]HUC91052.1 BglG family transcription antiterminator [Paenibacillus sp.]
MKLSNRQRLILEALLERQGDITAGEIAEEARVSTRTVHRELLDLEPLLHGEGLSLHKKSGSGIQLEGSAEALSRFQEALGRSETETYSPEERRLLILCRLLEEAEPVKMFALAHELHVAIPTVSNDLAELERKLLKNGLTLVRRRGYGVEICGPETAKRRLIGRLAEQNLDDSDMFGSVSGLQGMSPVTARLLKMVGKDHFLAIENALWQLEVEGTNPLSETDYTRLLIRLSVALTRMKRHHYIRPGAPGDRQEGAERSEHEYKESRRFAAMLELGPLPAAESEYLQRLLTGKEQDGPATPLLHHDLALVESVVHLVRFLEKQTDIPFVRDRSLLDGLIRHMGPAIERLRAGDSIRNPLLAQIKRDYASLFTIVREGVDETMPTLAVPDEEIGYIVMHFGASVERLSQFPRNVRALLVCTSGIGSSKLLAVRINKELPQIDLIGHHSWYEASRLPKDRYDLIISTVDLPLGPDRYVKLSPLLTREEAEKLRVHIQDITLKNLPDEAVASVPSPVSLDRLKRLKSYTDEVVRLLDGFGVYPVPAAPGEADLNHVVNAMLAVVAESGKLSSAETVAGQLLLRERQGSQWIPDTELALFHTRSDQVREPYLSLFRLPTRLRFGQDDWDAMAPAISHILLMLGPKRLGKESLEVLSEISAMLLLPEMIDLLRRADAEAIKTFLSQQLEQYIKNKMDWRD